MRVVAPGPELSDDPVVLEAFPNLMEAEMVQSMLEAEGIRSMVTSMRGSAPLTQSWDIAHRVLVMPADLAAARELLEKSG